MGTPIESSDDVQGIEAESAPGQNPAWNDVLSVLPEEFHRVVTPHFQQWDQAAQSRIEQANSKVKEFEAYQPFVENGISASELEQGMRLMYEINQNPQAVYEALAEAYNLSPAQVEAAMEDDDDDSDDSSEGFQDPRFEQLQYGLDLVGQIVLDEQSKKVQAQADAELDAEMNSLKEKHGDFDEKYVLSLMANDMNAEDAIKAYQNLTNQILQQNPRPFAPSVMGTSGGGSGYPSQAIDPTKLGGKETRDLVAQMLAAANKNS